MPDDISQDESVGRLVYEDLVHLTFLCGCGLTLPTLMERFLKAIGPRVPAVGMWLFGESGLVARFCVDNRPDPAAPSLEWRGLMPLQLDAGHIIASVQPEVVLVCALASGPQQRAKDVIALFTRILALAWQAELVACAGVFVDRYQDAKRAFKRHWLQALLDRHEGNVQACAQTSGLSRVSIYDMMKKLDVRPSGEETESGDRGRTGSL